MPWENPGKSWDETHENRLLLRQRSMIARTAAALVGWARHEENRVRAVSVAGGTNDGLGGYGMEAIKMQIRQVPSRGSVTRHGQYKVRRGERSSQVATSGFWVETSPACQNTTSCRHRTKSSGLIAGTIKC